ncbi:hypothetical protein [uncultured Flavobacterium sp.]|uniref:hypothetical protein n=1 Tax=uncultured Flavobacterium sp. TaxID=165435 RepID=UPI0025FF0705|nr:hypothetical protein [uncultured Flavobacterium sp.]
MEDRTKTTRNEQEGNANDETLRTGSVSNNDLIAPGETSNEGKEAGTDDTDKYLAMEQPGVTYTHESHPTMNSDHAGLNPNNAERQWDDMGGNSRNSDAFNQDDYLLDDNIDLDEDQNQSISSDDDDFEETNERYTN